MRFVGTAVVAGTIGVFSVLTGGEWIRAGTRKTMEAESAPAQKNRKASFRYEHFDNVVGLTVENVDGEKIGTINDLIVEPRSGQPRYVIVKSDGAWLTRRRLILVPTSAIALTTAKAGIAAVDITRQQWKRAPEFSSKELPSLGQPEKARQVARYYERAERVALASQTSERRSSPISSTGRETSSVTHQKGSYRLVRKLIGKQVVSRDGTEIGEVSDLMMDFAGEKPALAIISGRAISGDGDTFAVPLRFLIEASDDKVVVNAKRSDFKHAKQFQPENLGTIAISEQHEIFRYER